MSVRLRLQSVPPLPALRVWFLVPNNVTIVETFKVSLCEQLSVLKDASITPAQLILEIDEFELPEESTIDLMREGDIIMLKRREHVLKRKASVEENIQKSQKRRKLSTSSSSSASSESSSSSSSSSSDSDSDTSSSSSDAPPLPVCSKLPAKKTNPTAKPSTHAALSSTRITQIQSVPPGMGKPSTQSRNKRRKIKRKFANATNTGTHDPPSDDATVLALVADTTTKSTTQWHPETSVPRTLSSSLGNRNKSKGFKSAMENATPQKIVFPANRVFVAPSEREDLPSNMFVTSIEVEWRTGQRRVQSQWQTQETSDTLPTYQEEEAQPSQTVDQDAIDWSVVEHRWSEYPTLDPVMIENLSSVHIVAWKAFGLDPVSLTPQPSMLHMARVISVTPQDILVSLLVRPGIGQATFGRTSFDDGPEEASFPLTEIHSTGWKLINANANATD